MAMNTPANSRVSDTGQARESEPSADVALRAIADEQAALRRLATLVGREPSPSAVFAAVAAEAGRLLGADVAILRRYERSGEVTNVGGWTRTGEPAAVDWAGALPGAVAPVSIDGRVWGDLAAAAGSYRQMSARAAAQLAAFAELVAALIANAEAHAELAASRARIVAAADEVRRRMERDLHDGAQQRLVTLALRLQAAQSTVPAGLTDLKAELRQVTAGLAETLAELREYARGVHPAILSDGGLAPAVTTLVRRCSVPVTVTVSGRTRLPERVEIAAYYVVSEALTNAAKHAYASAVHVAVEQADGMVRLSISDDGIGGADPALGSGLVGLADRVAAAGGTLTVQSQPGCGTRLVAKLPAGESLAAATG
jgi:signal transduction histidine kinase